MTNPAPEPATDDALARALMVDGQLRPNKVTDRRILDAMRRLPREKFVPAALTGLAYIDADVPLGGGRVVLKPLVLARLLQLAAPRAGETALVVGGGSGYGAAVLAACGVQVTLLDSNPDLIAQARDALGDAPSPITVAEGRLAAGYPDGSPFDLVVIEGAVRHIPEAIGAQVAADGRLVTIIAPEGGSAYAAIAEPTTAGLRARAAFDAAAPLLPELVPAPVFTF